MGCTCLEYICRSFDAVVYCCIRLSVEIEVTLHGGSSSGIVHTLANKPNLPTKNGNRSTAMAATFQVAAPEPFNFSRPEEWTKWIRRFERFRMVSGLKAKGEEAQVNTLIYSMGDEADDILRSFTLSEEDRKKYSPVKEQFDAHFVKRRNVIFERAKFNLCKQEEGEPVDAFITALYALAEN